MDSMEIVFDGDGNQVTTNNSDVNAGLLMEDQNNKTPKRIHPYFDKNKCNRLSRSSSLNLKSVCSPSPAETISSSRSSTSKSDSRDSLSTLSQLSRSSSSCTNSKSRSYTMEKYMDRISSDEVERVNEALADLFFGCNIPFSVVESSHFKNFIDTIRPAYVPSIPSRKTLSGPLLDKAYKKSLTDCRSLIKNDDSVLLLDGWKNTSNNSRTVVSMLHTADNKRVFVDACDITGSSENSEKLEEIVDESVKIATEKFRSKRHAMVTDNAAAMLKMGRNVELWHSTCSSHTRNLLAKDIINESIISTTKTLLSKFKQADFERKIVDAGGSRIMTIADTRWCSYRDSAKCLLSNINIVRKLIIDKELDRITLNNDISDLIFDFQFFSDLEDFVKLSDPICELINKCQRGTFSIADATDLWLKLEIPNAYRANFQKRIDMALNIFAKVAYYLHPQYDSKKLSEEDILEVKEFLIDHLDSKGLQNLCENGFGIFRKLLSRKDLDALTFWKTLRSHCPSLSTLALKLLKIPASSAQIEQIFSNWSFIHSRLRNRLTFEKSKKLLHLYYTLKLRDNNSTDDY